MDIELLETFWRTVREYIPAKARQTAADHVMADLIDSGLEEEEAHLLKALDVYMRKAVNEQLPEEDSDDDEWEEDY